MTNPDGATLGRARGYIDLDTSGVRTAINDAKNQITGFVGSAGAQLTRWGDQMAGIGGQMTAMFAPLGIGLGAGIKMASDFDSSLAEIQARAGLTDEAMEEIRATALRLGADTAFSTQQATDAMLNLLTAGLSVEQSLETLPAVLTGAAAAGADLGQTADQVTNIMSSFQLEASEAERIVENMNRAAGASPASMSEMGEALTMVGGDARSFGLSLEQTSAALAILAQNGKRGSEAATQLRSMFTTMSSGTADNVKAWEMVGSSLFDASGNARDFGVVLEEIDAGLQNLSAEDQAFVIQNLAGSYGRVGLNALLASDGIEAMVGVMGEQASAADVAEARLDTFDGRVESMMGSIEAFGITVLTPFMNNVLKPLIEWFTGVVNVVTGWANANPELVQGIVTFLSVLSVAGPTLFAVGKAIAFVGFMMATLATPMGLILALVGAFGAAWATNFLGIRDITKRVVGFVRESLSILFLRDFKGFGSGFHEDNPIWNVFYKLHDKLAPIVQGIRHLIGTFFTDIKQFGLGEAFLGIFGQGSLGETMQSSLEGALTMMGLSRDRAIEIVNGIWTVVEPIFNVISTVFDAFSNAFTVFTSTLQSGEGIFTSLDFAIQTFFGSLGVGMPIISMVRSAIIDFINTVSGLWTAFQEGGVSGAATFIQDNILTPLLNSIKTTNWSQVAQDILGGIGTAFTTVISWATWIFNNILMPIVSYIGEAVATVDWGAVGSSIMSALGTAFTTLIAWGTWIFDNILTPIVTYAGEAIASIDWYSVGSGIVNAIGTALTTIFDFVGWIIDSIFNPTVDNAEGAAGQIDWIRIGYAILNGIGAALTTAFDFIMWIYDNILTPLVQGAADAIAQTDWSAVGQGLMDAIKNALPNIWQWVQDNIITPVSNALANFNPMDVVQGAGDLISSAASGAGEWLSNTFGGNRDSGGKGQAGTAYMIGRGAQPELFVPDSAGTFYPNADGMMGGTTYNLNIANINASSYEEGREAGRGFADAFIKTVKATP
jgi:TP901 family phage tail tape measure protein